MNYKLYLVGGYVRDEFLGIPSKDIDYSVVIEDQELDVLTAFDSFVEQIESEGFEVFEKRPNTLTVRAMFPEDHIESGVADFVIARKEIYRDWRSRTPTETVLGTLEDDLARRDFTVNAMARSIEGGKLIDPFGGVEDINYRILVTPGNTWKSFKTDSLRILRALRFHITKNFGLSDEIISTIKNFPPKIMEKQTSTERIQVELDKMFYYDTPRALDTLQWLKELNPILYYEILRPEIWIKTTTKKR